MQHVPQKWLRFLQLGLLLSDLSLIGIYLYMHFGGVPATTQKLWGNDPLIVLVVGIHMLYCLAAYFFLEKRYLWVANALSVALFGISVAVMLEITGNLNYFYQGLYLVLAFFFAMLGPLIPIAAGALVFILFFFALIGISHDTGLALGLPITLALDFGSIFLSLLGWRIFKGHYTDPENEGLVRLTGLLKTKQNLSGVLIQSIGDGIIVTDTTGKINLFNPAAAKMTGWPVDEALGIDVAAVVVLRQEDGKELLSKEDNPFLAVLQTGVQTTRVLGLEERTTRAHRTVSIVVSPIVDQKSNQLEAVVGLLRDISDERQEEQQRADFISTASHEMRTPVAAIEGYLALALNDKVSKIDTQARGFLEKAHASTQHLGQLFQDLLTSAKAEDGRLVSNPEVVDVGNFMEQLADSLRFAAEKKGLLTEFIVGSNEATANTAGGKVVMPLYYVHADPERLREVVTNLFDNAVKYTESGKVSIGLTGNKDVVQFYIRDTGPGIAAEDIPHLFQKFYRVDSSITRTIGGTGLGLFICRKIIELYQGRIWVESTLGHGSTFYINLPRLSNIKATELQTGQTNHPAAAPPSSTPAGT